MPTPDPAMAQHSLYPGRDESAVSRQCNCKKAKCLKLYCVCFAAGALQDIESIMECVAAARNALSDEADARAPTPA